LLITLTTDFGYQDAFAGIMKGVIAGINPQARVIDLTHGIPPQDLMAGALTLRHAIGNFPRGTIHIAVVDPGVGAARRPLLVEADSNYFIGPDNGVLSLALECTEPIHIVHLSNPVYHLQPTSKTFHGRDIFAPVAAHLSTGISAAAFGERLDSFVRLEVPKAVRHGRKLAGEIIYIDGYGNLFTNLHEHDLTGLPEDNLAIALGPVSIRGLTSSYASAQAGEFVAVLNSWGMLEIALYEGSARQKSGAKVGDKVTLTWDR
jgi:S-adenosylmethionine hydrolase